MIPINFQVGGKEMRKHARDVGKRRLLISHIVSSLKVIAASYFIFEVLPGISGLNGFILGIGSIWGTNSCVPSLS